MVRFIDWWFNLLYSIGLKKRKGLTFTVVKEEEQFDLSFRIMHNGYDYEVHVYEGDVLIYQNTGFETVEDAEQFIYFYKKNVYSIKELKS